jgi:hypothetical protein
MPNKGKRCLKSSVTFIQDGKMHAFGYLLLIICNFKPNWANLRGCAEKHDQLELCLTNPDRYYEPFPAVVYTDLYLKEIIEIDNNKKTIKVHIDLWAIWEDRGIALSNDSVK